MRGSFWRRDYIFRRGCANGDMYGELLCGLLACACRAIAEAEVEEARPRRMPLAVQRGTITAQTF